jgi:hypothetical protein
MPRAIKLQTTFNSGELDPRLAARTDVKQYYQGAAEALNVISMPQGGMKRRPGLAYKDGVLSSGSAGSSVRMASFSFNTEQTYLLVFTNLQIEIYMDGVSQATVTTPYTSAGLDEINWTQSADTMIIVHEDYTPATLTRGSSHTSWTWAGITFKNQPAFDFDDNYAALTFTLGSNRHKMHQSITVTASASVFLAKHVGGIFDAWAGGERGVGRITVVTSGTVATIKVLDTWLDGFLDEDDVLAGDAYIGEPVWSSGKGYPKTVTFYQGRLWFGGSTKRPQTVWGSVTNDFYNFDQGSGLDDESVALTLDTDQVNAITALFSARHLQIFTTGGEFMIPNEVITPEKASVKRQTMYGSGKVRPKNIDGSTLFLDRTGKSIREFVFTYSEDAYTSASTSILASHLLNDPVDMDILRGTSQDDANYFYLVNGDGTVAVYNMLRNQEVSGWTKWTTNGTVTGVCVVVDEVYMTVERHMGSTYQTQLEQLDVATFTDSNVTKTLSPAGVTVSGIPATMNGETLRVKADGAVVADAVTTAGSLTLAAAATSVEVGMNYDVRIKTMPLNIDFQNGPILTRKKRIVRIVLDVYESLGIYVDDELLADRLFGTGVLDTTPLPFTGIKDIHKMGWTDLAQVTIKQTDPLPLMLLGLSLEVEA